MMNDMVKKMLISFPRLSSWLHKLYSVLINSFLFLQLSVLNVVIRPFLHRPKYKKKYKIAICGIFKNEALFLEEWIEYHEMIGIEHFYLYNNNSDDNFKELLRPYIDRGLITLVEWPYDQGQIKAYKHFYENYRNETQWVTFLDIDEFFCPRYKETLYDWLKTKDKYPALLVYWRMFGTSGKMYHDKNSFVIEQYTVSWDHLYHCGKCLINTDYDIAEFNAMTHHLPIVKFPILSRVLKISVPPVNQFGWFVKDPFHYSLFYNEDKYSIQINHYWTKAWEIYEKKRRMTDVFFKDNPKLNMSYFYEHEFENRSVDYTIYRFLMQLKLKCGLYIE